VSATLLTYGFVALTFGIYIAIALWSRSDSTNEFYVAGGGVHPIANGAATAADWMSAASFLSMAGIIAFEGADGARYLMGGSEKRARGVVKCCVTDRGSKFQSIAGANRL